jgi:hypothetical protein
VKTFLTLNSSDVKKLEVILVGYIKDSLGGETNITRKLTLS